MFVTLDIVNRPAAEGAPGAGFGVQRETGTGGTKIAARQKSATRGLAIQPLRCHYSLRAPGDPPSAAFAVFVRRHITQRLGPRTISALRLERWRLRNKGFS